LFGTVVGDDGADGADGVDGVDGVGGAVEGTCEEGPRGDAFVFLGESANNPVCA